jgi:putative ABC transport system substrate-binding protein
VNVLVTGSDPAAIIGKKATGSIPMVFVVGGDPVALGLVSSLNRPDGNATGMTILTTSLEPKRIGLFREILPSNVTVGALFNPRLPLSQKQAQAVQQAARAINLKVQDFWASNDAEMTSAFDAILDHHIGALLVAADPFFDTQRDVLTGWTTRHKIPSMFQFRDYAVAGGLMSYGIDLPDVYRQIGGYTARILKGEKPSDLPVTEPNKFEFVINLKTAKLLGVTVPSGLMSIADEVIE